MLGLIRRLASTQECRQTTDADLVRRFAARRDEAAFEELLRRYGPMVYAVCRRTLGHEADTEDAFQAVFLVLARKAGAIARPQLLGNWLCGVAVKTALHARTARSRANAARAPLGEPPAHSAAPDIEAAELRAVIDQEIARLPERPRLAFMLCHVEGKTNEEAAQIVGCPKGTILSRLSWARERLRSRLAERGVASSASALAAATTAVAVPSSLAGETLQVALGRVTAAPEVLLLARKVKSMELILTKKAAFLLATAILGSGIAVYQAEVPGTPRSVPHPVEPVPVTIAGPNQADVAKVEWSAPVNGLEGRLVVVQRQVFNGTPILGLMLELRNASIQPIGVWNDREQVHVKVFDSADRAVTPSGLPRSGPVPNPQRGVVPRDSYLGFALDVLTVGVPKDAAALLSLASADWTFKPGKYKLRATFERTKAGGQENDWLGRMTLPELSIEIPPPGGMLRTN